MHTFEVVYRPLMQSSDKVMTAEVEPMADELGGFCVKVAPGRMIAEFRGHGDEPGDAVRSVVSSFGRVKLVREAAPAPEPFDETLNPEALAEAVRQGIDYAERLAPGNLFRGTVEAGEALGLTGTALHLFAAAAGHMLTRYHRLEVSAWNNSAVTLRIDAIERRGA